MTLTLNRPELILTQCLLGNGWIDTTSTFPVADPATGAVLADVPDCGPNEARIAVDAAHAAGQRAG